KGAGSELPDIDSRITDPSAGPYRYQYYQLISIQGNRPTGKRVHENLMERLCEEKGYPFFKNCLSPF
ncbi:MAG: hypothetical protein V3U91_03775, partial [Candidatus Aminicenantaceae bacterium]